MSYQRRLIPLFGGRIKNRKAPLVSLTSYWHYSHWHVDHVGDPSTFPSHVELVVGSGFKDAFLPGYPADPNGVILESDYE